MLVFEAFPIAGVVLSALILFMGCLNIFKYDSTTYNSIPTDPLQYSCALADEEDDEHDLNEPSEEEERKLLFFEIRNNTKNTTKDRLDHAAAIRQLVKRINIDANITKMVGSTIALSAALWGTLWQLSNRSNGHQVALYFFASNAIIWLYITGLSIMNLRHGKLATIKYGTHQTLLIAIAYFSGCANLITRYIHGILQFYLRETQFALLILLGAQIAAIGLLVTRKSSEVTTSGRIKTLEASASIFEWLSFSWMSPIMAKGAKSTLNNNDLWELPHKDQAVVITKKYDMYKPGMAFGTCKLFMTCKKQIAIQLTYGLLWSFTMFATPIFFYFLLNDLNNTNKDESHAWLYLAGLIASMVVSSICNQLGNMAGLHTAIQFKTIISNEIFKMCLKRRIPVLSNTDATTSHFDNNTDNLNVLSTTKYSPKSTEWDSGAVANLLNTDVNVLGEVMSLFHMFVGSTLQVIIAFSLLWCITGPASLFGLLALVIICILVGAKTIASPKYVSSYREACGKRLSIINEMLQSLRIIKLFAWEQQFCARIDEVREKELSVIWNYYVNFAIHFVGSTVSPVFVTVATLGTYTMLFGNTLNSTTAFTSIVLLESLRTAINQWSAAIYYYLQYRVIIQRITAFLSQPVLQSEDLNRPTMNDSSSERIGFINGEFSWNSANSSDASSNYSNTSTNYSNTSASSFCLNDLDIDFITGELNIITGPTGCGKSSLLMALLGEMPRVHGRVFLPTSKRHTNTLGVTCSNIGYVAQQPWLQNLTIRENILFGQPYDEQRYHQVLHACALERDLEILDAGDRTQIGEKGITLSGGQKQRLALARAVYGPYEYLLLDDCLSAVDSHTARHIVQNCLSGPLTAGRTRILVTHHVDLCASIAKYAVLMNAGQIVATGAPTTVLASLLTSSDSDSDYGVETASSMAGSQYNMLKAVTHSLDDKSSAIRADGVLVEAETYTEGARNPKVYKTYIEAGGYRFWALTAAAYFTLQLLIISQSYWLVIWTRNSTTETNGSYIRTYLWLAVAIMLFAMVPSLTLFATEIRASRKLFRGMLHSVTYASTRFLDKTPIGRIINRFSNDMNDVDQTMVFALQHVFIFASQIVFQLLVVCFAIPQFIVASILVFVLYFMLANYYVKASRNFKRLEAVNKSPLISLCTDMANGVATVRAFGMQKWFFVENLHHIDVMQRPSYLQAGAGQWITCRIQAISVVFTLFATSVFIWNRDYISANIAGFALSYTLGFLNSSATIVQRYTKVDVAMNSIERINEYLTLEQEPPAIIEHNRPPSNWPEHGKVEVQDLSIRYATDQSPVIRDLSFSVRPGERIGIVGRTGAGKSTLSVAFFRFVEAYAGRIVIDDVDISKIGLRDLRSRLTIIPQDPVLFSGTIRSNLDPFTMHDDAALWNALRRTHLIDEDINAEKPIGLEHLDAPVAENGSNFSHGQRQLLSMARALLRNSRVIIMDEATASVDFDTDAKIQQTIRKEFANSTLLCIAHRLRTIIDYDRVMVLDAGRLVELDAPSVLINRPDSLFRNLCERSGEFELLLSMSQSN